MLYESFLYISLQLKELIAVGTKDSIIYHLYQPLSSVSATGIIDATKK